MSSPASNLRSSAASSRKWASFRQRLLRSLSGREKTAADSVKEGSLGRRIELMSEQDKSSPDDR